MTMKARSIVGLQVELSCRQVDVDPVRKKESVVVQRMESPRFGAGYHQGGEMGLEVRN